MFWVHWVIEKPRWGTVETRANDMTGNRQREQNVVVSCGARLAGLRPRLHARACTDDRADRDELPLPPSPGERRSSGGNAVRYIALLRGINVGGHTVRMERLRSIFADLGCAAVRTYIQSGNVFFDAPESDRLALARHLEEGLAQVLGYEVPTFLRTVPELAHVVDRDPFRNRIVTPDMRLCVVFADAVPVMLERPWRSPKGDVEIVDTSDGEAYVVWHLVNGRPPSPQSQSVLGTRNTTRFFHTVAKILHAAQAG